MMSLFFCYFYENVIHKIKKGDKMTKFISQSKLEKQKTDNKSKHNVGEIYPQIFIHDKGLKFSKNMQLKSQVKFYVSGFTAAL